MDEHRINLLAEKIVNGSISEKEMAIFNEWYQTYDHLELEIEGEEGGEQLSSRMFDQIRDQAGLTSAAKNVKIKLLLRLAIAACLLVALSTGLFYLKK